MEKISSIVSGSPRISAVDVKESGPVRAGTPGFGRADQPTALKDRGPAFDGMRASAVAQEKMADNRSKEQLQANIAKEMSDKFFMRRDKTEEQMPPAGSMEHIEQAARPVRTTAPRVMAEEPEAREDLDSEIGDAMAAKAPAKGELYPKGSLINYMA